MAFLRNILNDPSRRAVIRVPSEIKYLRKSSSRVLSVVGAYGVDEGRAFDIKLCVEEAVRNAMVHGNNLDRKKFVKITCGIDGDALRVEVEDEGQGFDHAAAADPTAAHNILKNSGRGVYLIRKLMDSVEYNEKGNKITMTKMLN